MHGGYEHRQLYELVQNGADALLEASATGRITRFRVHRPDKTAAMVLQGHDVELRDGDHASTWRLFTRTHRPTEGARLDGGAFVSRDVVPVIWAVPHSRKQEHGQLWAFFPTEFETTLSGILNAPWKTNEDRQGLLRGTFNDELLSVAAELVATSLTELSVPDDPGRHLEAQPARDTLHWADERLSATVYQSCRSRPVVPDLRGDLRPPDELSLPPAVAPGAAQQRWSQTPGAPVGWCHPSALTRTRYGRVQRLTTAQPSTPAEWVSALAAVGSAAASIGAIEVLDQLLASPQLSRADEYSLRRAPVIRTDHGGFVSLEGEGLFLDDGIAQVEGLPITFVDPAVASDPRTREALLRLGVRSPGDQDTLAALLSVLLAGWPVEWWDFWEAVRSSPAEQPSNALKSPGVVAHLRVRALSGAWVPLSDVLLPGAVVGHDGDEPACTLDVNFHREELAVIEPLGIGEAPQPAAELATATTWFPTYRRAALDHYYDHLDARDGRPNPDYPVFDLRRHAGPTTPSRTLAPKRLRASRSHSWRLSRVSGPGR